MGLSIYSCNRRTYKKPKKKMSKKNFFPRSLVIDGGIMTLLICPTYYLTPAKVSKMYLLSNAFMKLYILWRNLEPTIYNETEK